MSACDVWERQLAKQTGRKLHSISLMQNPASYLHDMLVFDLGMPQKYQVVDIGRPRLYNLLEAWKIITEPKYFQSKRIFRSYIPLANSSIRTPRAKWAKN